MTVGIESIAGGVAWTTRRRIHSCRTVSEIAAALIVLSGWGCSTVATNRSEGPRPVESGTPTIDAAGARATIIAPGLEVVSRAPASGSVDGRDLQPRPGDESEWKLLAASASGARAPGEVLTVRMVRESRHGAAFALVEGEIRTLHLNGVEEGAPTMVATDAFADESVSRFAPALVLGRTPIAPGECVESQSTMVVEKLDGGRERDRGTATRRLCYAGDETIRTSLGEFPCRRIEIRFEANLRFAKATVTTVRWILPGVGPIAEQEHEKIVILGLIPKESSRVLVRTSPLPAVVR